MRYIWVVIKYIIFFLFIVLIFFLSKFFYNFHFFEKYCESITIGDSFSVNELVDKKFSYFEEGNKITILNNESPFFRYNCDLTIGDNNKVLSKEYYSF